MVVVTEREPKMGNCVRHKIIYGLAISALGGLLGISSAPANTLIVGVRTTVTSLAPGNAAILTVVNAQSPSRPTDGCPYGNSYADGCLGVASYGNFQNSQFFTYAKQSGQKQYYNAAGQASAHPPPWNVAGVDYPVGYSTAMPLKDPAAGRLPTGCSYNPMGSKTGGPIVTCAGVKNLTLDGWDFSLHNCMPLDIKGSNTGTVTISNSKFVNGPNCSTHGYFVMVVRPAPVDVVFTHNYVDGQAQLYPLSLINLLVMNETGSLTVTYNAFLRSPARPIGSVTAGSTYVAYNYFEGFVYHASDGHCEVLVNLFNGSSALNAYSFNTVLQPRDIADGQSETTFLLGGSIGGVIQKVVVDHNSVIINKNAAGNVTTAAAVAEAGPATYGSVRFEQNYADGTGSYACFIAAQKPTFLVPPALVGNFSMVTGRPITTYTGATPTTYNTKC